ncbi:TetR/AcrR family transcriptional regulator [Spongiactinospora gelatinilytica]|uniref:TetR/AcrR family transcriptional regulator n=1 Tax=Spongiactinospora gelatinilytica TaxID=2666298 RepID=A0A2W2H2H7_9ACTN|nr:TetR/AcrR family transcriptional regulator [Spongiactinospora gelatinilytica]PZG56276.1 TetR/AcrR family transcriptional regulator [Spongiactinospora gelatinilytica]
MSRYQARNRRADALRSRAAILDAALRLLRTDPDASVEAIAIAADVTRQTVYAHFRSREQLLAAVVEQVTDETAAAMDAADPDTGPATEALLRVLDAAARTAERYPGLIQAIVTTPVSPHTDRKVHAPISERLIRVIERGRLAGEFDDRLPAEWLAMVTVKLAHAASEQVTAGRMPPEEAAQALRTTLLRALTP